MARKGPLRKRLRELVAQEDLQRRDLGVLVLQMYRRDNLDQDALGRRVGQLAGLQNEMADIRRVLGETVGSEPARGMVTLPPAAAGIELEPVPDEPGQVRTALDEGARTSLEELTVQVEDAEQRVHPAVEAARLEAEDRATDEILALEEDLEREQQRAGEALEQLRAQLEQAEQKAAAAEAGRQKIEAEARSAAAEWLRGQAAAMRREAERQVREELAGAATDAPVTPQAGGDVGGMVETASEKPEMAERIAVIEKAKAEAEQALAEMTRRSNEANARAQQAEAALQTRTEELAEEREAKSRALQAADQRLAEIEQHAVAATDRIEAAERQFGEETERIRSSVEELRRERDEAIRRLEEADVKPKPAAAGSSDRLNLSAATFEQLREVGMSVTQANRVIAHRERLGGFTTIDDLDGLPGFPRGFLDEIKKRVEV